MMSDRATHVENFTKHNAIDRSSLPQVTGWLAAWILLADLVYVALYWPTFLDLLRSLHRLWLTW